MQTDSIEILWHPCERPFWLPLPDPDGHYWYGSGNQVYRRKKENGDWEYMQDNKILAPFWNN
jgi:hypothetical protein